MAALLLDALARWRANRAEAAARAAFAALKEDELDACHCTAEVAGAPAPFVPRCCWDSAADRRAGGAGAKPPPHYPIEVIRDVDYSSGSGPSCEQVGHPRLKLDIFYAPGAIRQHMRASGSSSVPVTMHVHGGGWQRGDKNNEWRGGPNAGRAGARHGMVSCVIGYRLHPADIAVQLVWTTLISFILSCFGALGSSFVRSQFLWSWTCVWSLIAFAGTVYRVYDRNNKAAHPQAALDAALAVAWIRAHIGEFVAEADPDRLFLSGHSAGGHLVSLLVTDPRYLRSVEALEARQQPADIIRGVCAISGIYDLTCPVAEDPSSIHNVLFRFGYTASFGRSAWNLKCASPMHHACAGAPPFLLISASSDLGLDVDARRFAARLACLCVPVQHHTVAHTSHSTIASRFEEHEAHAHMFDFIQMCCANNARQATAVSKSKHTRQALAAHNERHCQTAAAIEYAQGEPGHRRSRRTSDAGPVRTNSQKKRRTRQSPARSRASSRKK